MPTETIFIERMLRHDYAINSPTLIFCGVNFTYGLNSDTVREFDWGACKNTNSDAHIQRWIFYYQC